jgi:hypothetical protein
MHALVLELLEWSRSACPEMLWPLTTMLNRLTPKRTLVNFADVVKEQEDTEEESEQDGEKVGEESDESDFVLV